MTDSPHPRVLHPGAPLEDRRAAELSAAAERLTATFGKEIVQQQLSALSRHGEVIDDPVAWLQVAVQHRFKFRTIERVRECPCGGRDLKPVSGFVFWNLLGYCVCTTCGTIVVSPRLTAESLAQHFAEHYFDTGVLADWVDRRTAVNAQAVSHLTRLGVVRMLDIGSAYGALVNQLRRRGIDAIGLDISAPAVKLATENFGPWYETGTLQSSSFEDGSFDAVTSMDTLYYAAEPRAELEAMRKIVRPAGYGLFRIRNCRFSQSALAKAAHGAPLLPSEHLYGFSATSLTRVLAAAGWRVMRVESGAWALPSRTPRFARQAFRWCASLGSLLPTRYAHSILVVARAV